MEFSGKIYRFSYSLYTTIITDTISVSRACRELTIILCITFSSTGNCCNRCNLKCWHLSCWYIFIVNCTLFFFCKVQRGKYHAEIVDLEVSCKCISYFDYNKIYFVLSRIYCCLNYALFDFDLKSNIWPCLWIWYHTHWESPSNGCKSF